MSNGSDPHGYGRIWDLFRQTPPEYWIEQGGVNQELNSKAFPYEDWSIARPDVNNPDDIFRLDDAWLIEADDLLQQRTLEADVGWAEVDWNAPTTPLGGREEADIGWAEVDWNAPTTPAGPGEEEADIGWAEVDWNAPTTPAGKGDNGDNGDNGDGKEKNKDKENNDNKDENQDKENKDDKEENQDKQDEEDEGLPGPDQDRTGSGVPGYLERFMTVHGSGTASDYWGDDDPGNTGPALPGMAPRVPRGFDPDAGGETQFGSGQGSSGKGRPPTNPFVMPTPDGGGPGGPAAMDPLMLALALAPKL